MIDDEREPEDRRGAREESTEPNTKRERRHPKNKKQKIKKFYKALEGKTGEIRARVCPVREAGGMPAKGERGKATDFSIAAIMAPRGPSFGHYHLQGLGNAASNAVECNGKAFVASSNLDHREFIIIRTLESPPMPRPNAAFGIHATRSHPLNRQLCRTRSVDSGSHACFRAVGGRVPRTHSTDEYPRGDPSSDLYAPRSFVERSMRQRLKNAFHSNTPNLFKPPRWSGLSRRSTRTVYPSVFLRSKILTFTSTQLKMCSDRFLTGSVQLCRCRF